MKSQTEKRKTLMVLISNDAKWFHLGDFLQLAGTNECTPTKDRVGGKLYDLWFPAGADLFTTVESVLQFHGIAHNLTSLEPINAGCFRATYNAK